MTDITPTIERLEGRRLLSKTPLFAETDLVSDGGVPAQRTDAGLKNPWGLVITKSEVWISDAGSGISEVLDKAGNTSLPSVTIPAPASGTTPITPTGVVFNNSKAFNVTSNGVTGPSIYLFATTNGTIAGWNPAVDQTNAVNGVDNSISGAVYTGLTSVGSGKHALLFAANIGQAKVDTFDSNFQPVTTRGGFVDANIPAGYGPFNVQNVSGNIFVTYAIQDRATQKGAGQGFVDEFDTKGQLKRRFASGGTLNAPWAVVGVNRNRFGGDILVGNFGDGRINVFSSKGAIKGQLTGSSTQPITIPFLWGLASSDKNTLLFTAGANDEIDGLFGSLTAAGTTTIAPASGGTTGGGSGGFNY